MLRLAVSLHNAKLMGLKITARLRAAERGQCSCLEEGQHARPLGPSTREATQSFALAHRRDGTQHGPHKPRSTPASDLSLPNAALHIISRPTTRQVAAKAPNKTGFMSALRLVAAARICAAAVLAAMVGP